VSNFGLFFQIWCQNIYRYRSVLTLWPSVKCVYCESDSDSSKLQLPDLKRRIQIDMQVAALSLLLLAVFWFWEQARVTSSYTCKI
jgi:hypothetical protein